MYLELFNLIDLPFQLTPDTDYLYLSKSHSRAIAYMDYSIWNQEGFVVITGEVGAGKTLMVHKLLSDLPSNVVIANVFQTQLNEVEFLQAVLVDFGLNPFKAEKVELMDMLNTFLIQSYAESKQAVLLVDDAQNLNKRVLEEIRMLSNLEVKGEKILHIILIGQPELNTTLEMPELEQLLQRIRLRFHISPLTRTETKDYVVHRLRIAGAGNREIFLEETFDIIHKYTGGIPRLINSLCDTSLTCAYADEFTTISKDIIITAIDELRWKPFGERKAQLQRQKDLKIGNKNNQADNLAKMLESNTRLLSTISEKLGNLDLLTNSVSLMADKIVSIERLLENIMNKGQSSNTAIKPSATVQKVTSSKKDATAATTKKKSGTA